MTRLVIGAAIFLLACPALAASAPRVLLARYSGVINPPAAEYVARALSAAQTRGDEAAIIELDTPGGLDASMREIVKSFFASRVPVVVYVAPAGARAASAGVFIAMSASVAAMAPGTNIGAAHPVELGGFSGGEEAPQGPMAEKIRNDAQAYLRAIAQKRGRNKEWAASAVAQSASITAEEAVHENVVDLEADNVPDLLRRLDGRKVQGFSGVLLTKNAAVDSFPMTRREKILRTLADPNLAAILMTLGVSGLLIELYHPGLIFPGAAGAAALILAFYSFQNLSISAAAVLLLAVGLVLFILEFKFHGLGLLAVAGAGLALGGVLLLFRDSGVAAPWAAIIGTLAVLAFVFSALSVIVRQALKHPPTTGGESLLGARGAAATDINPTGKVRINGEIWDGQSVAGPIAAGQAVEVVSTQGLSLKVRPVQDLNI